jgi:uncharacterized RDD family membrane protein YckC
MSALGLLVRRLAAFGSDILALAVVLVPLSFLVNSASLGTAPRGQEVWVRIAITVSLPAWAYFIVTDRRGGQSLGKRLVGLRTARLDGRDPGWGNAVGRTALKLLPWELTHAAFFLMSSGFERVTPVQLAVAASAYALMLVYLVVGWLHDGARSLPDLLAKTRVTRVAVPSA